jgi:hydroxymethylpyrimidine/phosphomethylpyrimidine kinase
VAGRLLIERQQCIALTVGGSDSSGQAGVQADLRTFAAHDVHGLTAITALTVQNHERVVQVEPTSAVFLERQVQEMLQAFPVRAIKTGMLVSASHVRALKTAYVGNEHIPMVLDPVLLSTSETRLLDPEGEAALWDELLPLARVFTPNIPEAAQLTGIPEDASPEDLATACAKGMGPHGVVVLKGGHGHDTVSRDIVRLPNGVSFRLDAPWIDTGCSRGTGCTFAAAIASGLASKLPVDMAIRQAKAYITGALKHGAPLRAGRGPVDQLWQRFDRGETTHDG